jgi:hypothetical protein
VSGNSDNDNRISRFNQDRRKACGRQGERSLLSAGFMEKALQTGLLWYIKEIYAMTKFGNFVQAALKSLYKGEKT